MVFVGYFGSYLDIYRKKGRRLALLLVIILFILTVFSRINHSFEDSDLTHYLEYYGRDYDAYFEFGYLYFSKLVKNLFGDSPYYLILSVIFVNLMMLFATERILSKYSYPKKIKDEESSHPVIILTIFVVSTGLMYCGEGLRPGLSMIFITFVAANAVVGRFYIAFLFLIIATLFHTQAFVFSFGLILLYFVKVLDRNKFYLWISCIIIVDISLGFLHLFDFSFFDRVFLLLSDYDNFARYDAYYGEESPSYFNTQYLTRNLIGLLLLKGNLNNCTYNRSVILYFIGLSIGSIFQDSIVGIRFIGIFTNSFLIAFYCFMRDAKYPTNLKMYILILHIGYNGTRLLRILGWYV